MPPRKDITGQRFGRLVAIRYAYTKQNPKYAVWECKCDCGKTHFATAKDLVSGNTKSCGCYKRDVTLAITTKDGRCLDRLHKVWSGMKTRCYNPKADSYKYYGGRGITVCDEWLNDYAAFRKWAYENGYDDKAARGECTIDRIDVNGQYSPENCRFVDCSVQTKNRRKAEQPKQRKAVQLVDKTTGEVIREFPSVTEAHEATGADMSLIVKYCKGKLKGTGTTTWRYKSDAKE